MRTIPTLGVLLTVLCVNLSGQDTSPVSSETVRYTNLWARGITPSLLVLETNHVARFMSMRFEGGNDENPFLKIISPLSVASSVTITRSEFGLLISTNGTAQNLVIAGPATLELGSRSANSTALAVVAVQENVTGRLVPNSAVVVPDDLPGAVEIRLESSNDLTNWDPEYIGQHGGDLSSKRFWRARVVRVAP